MCAIAGMIHLPSSEQTENKMLETMSRRGPDNAGVYQSQECTLLHSRLAVIDPEGGQQPMTLRWGDETYALVYNGELYNTQEIRDKLLQRGHQFLGHSDTEVLLHAYAQWGQKCITMLNGIYSFAIWEEKKKSLILVRDRMGVKPLFYCFFNDGLLFASELKTILAYPKVRPVLDAQGVAELLLLGPGRTPGCGVLQGMKEIKPGWYAVYEGGKLHQQQYWCLRDRNHRDSFEQTVEAVRYLVLDAIKRQMVSDVPIGTFLSGGLDSSIISSVCATEMKKQGKRLNTFSVDYVDNEKFFTPSKFQPNSDGHFIRTMQEYLDSEHHWCVLSPQDLMDSLEESVIARDLPGMADVDISLLAFCKKIKEKVTVALSGECADEIFGGYPWYRDPEVRALDGFPWAQNIHQRMQMLSPALSGKIGEEYIRERYERTCKESDILSNCTAQERRMKEMVNLNQQWFMQTLLDRKDRMSMYSGLEVRVPFCDYRIAEYLYGVPWAFKDYHGKEKGLLRCAMEGILPEEVLWRKKSPYPKTHDPRYLALVKEKLNSVLMDKDAPLFSLVDRKALQALMGQESPWPWYGQLMKQPQTICYFLQMDFWLRHYNVVLDY